MRFPAAILLVCAAGAAPAQVRILGYWWENPISDAGLPRGLASLSAKQCGACHREIYREWSLSAHARALSDLQFQAEMSKEPETAWLCLNCHTPLKNQLARVAIAVRQRSAHQPVMQTNPSFDPGLRQEGVTCAVCHVREGLVLGPFGGSQAPHPVRRDPQLLRIDVCAQCHQANAGYTDTLVCSFDTAQEWRASPAGKENRVCSGCHMPAVERPLAVGFPPRPSRLHYFMGSRISKLTAPEPAERKAMELFQPGLAVDVLSARRQGREALVELRLRNARAGHMLPTGDPERYVRVDVRLSTRGRLLATRSLRIGQQWQWWPTARKLADNRLQPGEERLETVRLPVLGARTCQVEVRAFNCRLSERNARYHNLVGRYPMEAEVLRLPPLTLR